MLVLKEKILECIGRGEVGQMLTKADKGGSCMCAPTCVIAFDCLLFGAKDVQCNILSRTDVQMSIAQPPSFGKRPFIFVETAFSNILKRPLNFSKFRLNITMSKIVEFCVNFKVIQNLLFKFLFTQDANLAQKHVSLNWCGRKH